MESSQRKYKQSDATMLIAAATIMDSAIANNAFLQSKRNVWKEPFFQNLRKEIDVTIKDYLGVDGAQELRKATKVINENMAKANMLLAEVKIQIEEDFKQEPDKRDEILLQLGFKGNFKKAKNGNQEVMLQLLTQFATNITGDIEKAIIEKGIASESLKEIVDLANALPKYEITQEGKKNVRLATTEEIATAFNQVYNSVISVCKIAAKFYKGQSLLKQQFSFTKVAAMQSFKAAKAKAPADEAKLTS